MSGITVYTARRIHTMNPSMPRADAVAVRDGRIVEAGTLETLSPWLDAHPHVVDRTFERHVLMPGFIDPHLHPPMAAVLLPLHFITAMEWRLPWGTVPQTRGADAYLARLREIEGSLADPAEPLITWGYHEIWHGPVHRQALNRISATRPVVVWQRSFHALYANDAALRWMDLDEETLERHPQIDAGTGHFFETGLGVANARMAPYLLDRERFRDGLRRVRQAVHHGGHTTIADMAFALFDQDREWAALCDVLDRDDTPFRVHMVPRVKDPGSAGLESEVARVRALRALDTGRLAFHDHVKLFTDGGFFAELMQVQPPGFIDGHHGEWLMAPERFEALARAFWNEGYRIHVHCTGDLGLELAIEVLAKLQWERPRFDHRFTIEHFGLSTPEQIRRLARLGGLVSANVYYVYELADAYWKHSIGHERATRMARLATVVREGIPLALHSDFTMAPAQPLNHAWVAVNRVGDSGEVASPEERLTLEQALRAITIDAAFVLGMEDEVGSIRAGKRADFTVLEADPFEEPVESLKDIPLWGTVFEGRPFPIR